MLEKNVKVILLFLVVSSLHFIGDFISFSPSSNISQLFLPHLLTVGLTAVPVFSHVPLLLLLQI